MVNQPSFCTKMRQQRRDEDVAQHDAGQGALGDLVDAGSAVFHELRAVEARSHDEHGHDHDAVGIAEVGGGGGGLQAAGEDKGDHAEQRGQAHGELAPDVACHGKDADDQADGKV